MTMTGGSNYELGLTLPRLEGLRELGLEEASLQARGGEGLGGVTTQGWPCWPGGGRLGEWRPVLPLGCTPPALSHRGL